VKERDNDFENDDEPGIIRFDRWKIQSLLWKARKH
jgi:hypothetical protein